jgi:hypothetical protein
MIKSLQLWRFNESIRLKTISKSKSNTWCLISYHRTTVSFITHQSNIKMNIFKITNKNKTTLIYKDKMNIIINISITKTKIRIYPLIWTTLSNKKVSLQTKHLKIIKTYKGKKTSQMKKINKHQELKYKLLQIGSSMKVTSLKTITTCFIKI